MFVSAFFYLSLCIILTLFLGFTLILIVNYCILKSISDTRDQHLLSKMVKARWSIAQSAQMCFFFSLHTLNQRRGTYFHFFISFAVTSLSVSLTTLIWFLWQYMLKEKSLLIEKIILFWKCALYSIFSKSIDSVKCFCHKLTKIMDRQTKHLHNCFQLLSRLQKQISYAIL